MFSIQSCTLHYTLHLSNKYIKLHLLFSITTLLYKFVQGLLSLKQYWLKLLVFHLFNSVFYFLWAFSNTFYERCKTEQNRSCLNVNIFNYFPWYNKSWWTIKLNHSVVSQIILFSERLVTSSGLYWSLYTFIQDCKAPALLYAALQYTACIKPLTEH